MADNESGKRIFQIEDIYDQETVSNPVLSPDGVWCAYVLSIPEKNDRGASDQIVLYQLRSKEKRVLIEGASPQWSPDGKFLAFESWVSDVVGIYIYDIQKDSATLLVNKYDSDFFIDHYAEKNFCWSPDGKSIFYVSTDATEIENKNVITREFNHLLYKTKGGRGREKYADSRISHLWSVNIESRSTLQITKGSFNEHSISASSSGSFLYFISNRSKNPDQNQWGRLFAIKIESREERALSPERESAFQPKCSPDGKYIAYLGIKSEVSTNDSPAEDTQIYIVSSLGGEVVCLTDKLDRRVEQFQWDSSSSSIFFTAGDAGSVFLYSVSIIDREITTIIKKQGKVLQFDISQDGKYLAFTHMDSTQLPDIFLLNLKDNTISPITSYGAQFTTSIKLSPAETFWFKSFDDLSIQAWIVKPVNFIPGQTYPLILVIHGGPHNMFGYEFDDRIQLLAAKEYGVLYINPRGSSGYGQSFSNGTLRSWGENDFEDLMKGVDSAMKNFSWIDPNRLGVTGQSYGGYMTNRIITKTTRFKAAVADGSISNLISFAGTSLYHSLMESEFGPVYKNFDSLWKSSPLKDVLKVKTPTLFLHGETDNEVPVSQAEEMFVAIKKLGVETSLVQYIGEGHGWRPDLKPAARIDLLNRMINWFDKYLKK